MPIGRSPTLPGRMQDILTGGHKKYLIQLEIASLVHKGGHPHRQYNGIPFNMSLLYIEAISYLLNANPMPQ